MGGDKDSLINEGKGKNKPKGCKAKVITPHLPQAATATSHPQTTHFSEEEEKVWTLYECFLPKCWCVSSAVSGTNPNQGTPRAAQKTTASIPDTAGMLSCVHRGTKVKS